MASKSSRRTPLIVLGALLLLLGAAALFVTREPRASRVPAPKVMGSSGVGGSQELLAAEPPPEDTTAERRVEEATSAEQPPGSVEPRHERGSFQGEVVDVATGEPVAFAGLVAGPLQSNVDGQGRWRCAEPLPAEVQQIEFHNRVQGTHIRSVRREDLEQVGDRWLARIEIGPTYRVNILGEEGIEDWRARLVETEADGSEVRGSWIKLQAAGAGEPPFLRYDNAWEPNAQDSSFRVEVRDSMATRRGASDRLVSAVGIYPEVVAVTIDLQLATARGRVLDVAEQPIKRARLIAAPLDADGPVASSDEEAERWPQAHTDDQGLYHFLGLMPGPYRIHVRPRRGQTPQSRTVDLPPGETELDDFVFAVQEGAGMIEGVLKSRRGEDFEHKEIVRLRAVDGRDFELLDISSSGGHIQAPFRRTVREPGEEGQHVFEFNEVPAGQYQLSVVAQDGYTWSPGVAAVEPPSDEIVFWREDQVPHRTLELEVFDLASGDRVERFHVQHQIGGTWNAGAREHEFGDTIGPFPSRSDLRLTVHAVGYRPRWLQGAALASEGTVRVELEPGWGHALYLRDLAHGFDSDDEDGRLAGATRPAVAGAEIWIDGEHVASTDSAGLVRLGGAPGTEPRRIEIRAPGWRVVGSGPFREGRILGRARDVVIWLVRI